MLQALFVSLLVGSPSRPSARAARPYFGAVEHLQRLVFKILVMVSGWPRSGRSSAGQRRGTDRVGRGEKSADVHAGVLPDLRGLRFRSARDPAVRGVRVSIFTLVRYLAREYLLVFATSSSESALPRLIAKMEHLGIQPSTVGVVVPTGYSFNLDGTAIYLTMASLFIADALGKPLSVAEQIGLLAFMIVASKGAAGVSGAGWRHWRPGCRPIAPTFSTVWDSSSASIDSCLRPVR